MNFQIFLKKNNIIPVDLAIEILQNDYMIYYDNFTLIENDIIKEFSIKNKIIDQYILKISRHEQGLYHTQRLTHESHVFVDKIILDNFWTIDEKNHWSTTSYDQKYVNHLKDKQVTWELSKKMYNNILYFNGSLIYNITIPIRGMFFK